MKAIMGKRVVFPTEVKPGCLIIQNGKVQEIHDQLPAGFDGIVEDFGELVIMPGLVDTHVHINEPGRTEWEGFNSATRAAAAGGITTIIDMPLNCSPVTTTKSNLETKIAEVKDKLWVDVGFWGGVVPASIEKLPELLEAGVFGVKSFLIDSGIDEFPEMTRSDLEKAMPILAKYQVPYLIHAEIDDPKLSVSITEKYQTFLDSRPRSFENNAIELMIDLVKTHKTPVHIVHLSSSDVLKRIQVEKANGLPLTVETCPHYLCLQSEKIPDGKTIFKCCPPIREAENCEALWNGLKDRTIDFIVSDHSPCTPQLKCADTGSFDEAWGGISSLQFGLSLIWSELSLRGMGLNDLAELMCQKTAEFIGLGDVKGKIQVGMQADFVVWNPEEAYTISPDLIHHKHKVTPYEGNQVLGVVHRTYLAGESIYDGSFGESPIGKTLLKEY